MKNAENSASELLDFDIFREGGGGKPSESLLIFLVCNKILVTALVNANASARKFWPSGDANRHKFLTCIYN